MKCPKCGNNLNIEDKFCPYCGEENTFAKEHQESMEHYEAEFEATKEDVINETKRFKNKTIKITTVAILLVVALGMIILAAFSDDIRYNRQEKTARANAAKYTAQLDQYIKDRDYFALSEYMNANHISYNNEFNEYQPVYQASYYYENFYGDVLNLLTIKSGDDKRSYVSESDLIQDAGKYLSKINETRKVDEWYAKQGAYSKEKVEYMDDLMNNAILLVEAYFNVPAEEAEKIPELTEARIIVLLEDYYG